MLFLTDSSPQELEAVGIDLGLHSAPSEYERTELSCRRQTSIGLRFLLLYGGLSISTVVH